MGECFFWYWLTWVVPDKIHRAVKRLCVCVCGHDPPMSQMDRQTDGQTDDMRSQDRALHYSASCGKKTTSKYHPLDLSFSNHSLRMPAVPMRG